MTRERDDVISSLVRLCEDLGVTCLVQVGAEDGYEALKVQEATLCKAVCIDADPKCQPCSPLLDWHCALIGATDSVMPFYLHPTLGLSTPFPRGDNGEIRIDLTQHRLDGYCRANGIAPDALIIDTEGSTLDVLEGCGAILDGVKFVYAEVQTEEIRPGMRLLPEVTAFLESKGFRRREGPPEYSGGAQGNYTWVRTSSAIRPSTNA